MIGMYLDTLHCDEGTSEIGSDEPYVIVAVVNLKAVVQAAGFPVPLRLLRLSGSVRSQVFLQVQHDLLTSRLISSHPSGM